jgi:hypothetical protein
MNLDKAEMLFRQLGAARARFYVKAVQALRSKAERCGLGHPRCAINGGGACSKEVDRLLTAASTPAGHRGR